MRRPLFLCYGFALVAVSAAMARAAHMTLSALSNSHARLTLLRKQAWRSHRRRQHWTLQLDHEGRHDMIMDKEDLIRLRQHVLSEEDNSDDALLRAVSEKLRQFIVEDPISAHLETAPQHVEEVESDGQCYAIPVETASGETSTYYMCTDAPDDNDNLRCETFDGMDWVCVTRDDPHDDHLSNYGV